MATGRISALVPSLALPDLRISVWEGCFAIIPQTFTTGVFLFGFVLLLGADPWTLGLVAAIPAISQVAQLFAPVLLLHATDRKTMTVWAASISRYLWLLIAVLPFLPLSSSTRLNLFFGVLALSTILGQIAGVAWSDWMGDAVPATTRGSYFGFRNAITALVGILCVLTGTTVLDAFKGDHLEAMGFATLFLCASAGALLSQLALLRQAEPPRIVKSMKPREVFATALADRRFVLATGLIVGWMLICNVTAPFCYAYALGHLNVTYAIMGIHALIFSAVGVVCQPFWGRLIDRKGSQFTLLVAMIPVSVHPIYWLALSPDSLWGLWADALSSGICWSGITLAMFALVIEIAPSEDRPAYFAVFNSSVGVATCAGALLGGAILTLLGSHTFRLGEMNIVAFQVLLVPALFARIAWCWFFGRYLCNYAASGKTFSIARRLRALWRWSHG